MDTYTSGPWTVITENKGLSLGITNDQSVPIASRIVDQSNARLIAAAPELLQVAIAFCDLANPQELDERGHHDMAELCRMARAAIDKATA